MNEMGRFEDDLRSDRRCDRERREGCLSAGKRCERTGAGQGRERRGAARCVLDVTESTSTISMCSILREDLGGISTWKRRSASGWCRDLPAAKIVQAGNTAIEGATIALLSKSKRQELEELVKTGGALPPGNASEFLRVLCGGLPVQARGADAVRAVSDRYRAGRSALRRSSVQLEEYVRLLGYPRGWVLEGRALRAGRSGRGTGTRNMAGRGSMRGRRRRLRWMRRLDLH